MHELEFIQQNITPNSLVIIEELCRSTNPTEGAQLAWSWCVNLLSVHGVGNDGEYFDEKVSAEPISIIRINLICFEIETGEWTED